MPEIIKKGEWIDLKAAEDVELMPPMPITAIKGDGDKKVARRKQVDFDLELIPLGIVVKMPKGYEAVIASRSSSLSRFGFILDNGIGIVDNSYCGEDDEWKVLVLAIQEARIKKGDRICQFRVQLSQKATLWQKLKWLFSSRIKIKKVKELNTKVRGGFGSTGTN